MSPGPFSSPARPTMSRMGVLTEYFTVAEDRLSREIITHGPSGCVPEDDVLLAKGIDPVVMLGQLGQQLTGVDFLEIGQSQRCGGGEHYSVERLTDAMRDALAAIDDADVPAIAARWATIEEWFGDVGGPDVEWFVTDIAALARNAAGSGRHLYCWWSL